MTDRIKAVITSAASVLSPAAAIMHEPPCVAGQMSATAQPRKTSHMKE
eukprot:CAMPEP_0119024686 /NCGR_PEP_ID=MMETSP1176-20130426/32328_1 /TAXON_ID=265551 /ORGANISM="Synedropsis recta cf, Strain CCMP1620" /LENGTH=47 /DNA_ID= /DNA_START= /DNA_END= /DNA_ORIENTATION=